MPLALKRFMQDISSDIGEVASPGGDANITHTLPQPTPVTTRTTPYIYPKIEVIQGHTAKSKSSERL